MSADNVTEPSPNLNLTPEEKRVYGQLFRQADTDNVGVVTGEVAVRFFEKTRLDSRILGEIWQIADRENRGFLTPAGFGIVLRLIGHAQAGREPTAELALQHGPIPRFDGIMTTPAAPLSPTALPLQAQGTGGGPIRIPPLTPEKVAQYTGLFERQIPAGATMLPGEQAKQIFEKSGLPNEVLGKIWQLADTEQRGALVPTEFVIAMHLLTSMKSGALRGLPNILPAALYEAATRRPAAARQSPAATGPISSIPRQLSGSAQMRTGSPLGRPPLMAQSTGAVSDWLVTPADKAKFDKTFDDLDHSRKGYVTGEESVEFLKLSQLDEDTLAQIWDLADINSEGRLNKDTFAVAMYLIRQKRMRKDDPAAIPASLPPALIPPSMRGLNRPPTAGSPFDVPPQPPAPPKSALDDLFGLDAAPTPPSAPLQTALSTGGSNNDLFGAGSAILAANSPVRPSPTTATFKPFVPSSSFGRGLTAQPTGGSSSSTPAAAPAPISEDLLGDADPEVSKKLTNETAELANLSNQVSSLSKQMQDVQGQRTTAQNQLNQANAQKINFEQRLSQLRALYEKEAQDVRSIEEQLATSRKDTQRLQGECLSLEGVYQDIQQQHQQVLSALQADQSENMSLKEKIRVVNAEIAQLKPQIEKLKSEARQQKGLVAINKKQLATGEGERDKLKSEAEELARSNEEMTRQMSTSPPLASSAAQVASPALSTASGNNPFFKRTGSTDIMGAFTSPTVKPFNDKSFDDVFGPSFPPPSSTATPPPPVSFKQQDTGNSTASMASFATPGTSTPNLGRPAMLSAEAPSSPDAKSTTSSLPSTADATARATAMNSFVPESSAAIPAFPVEADIARSPTHATSDGVTTTDAAQASRIGGSGADTDPFAAMDQHDKAKADFDSAFASMQSPTESKATDKPNAFAAFNTEFPPISELEHDDESESASEHGGFDDDFAPASPKAKAPVANDAAANKVTSSAPKEAASSSGHVNTDVARPAMPATTTGASNPTAESALGPSPFSKTTLADGNLKADDIFGTTPSHVQPPPPAIPSKAPFDDLDDDFEGLEDAKEGSADDDFATISRSGLDDFNHVFDSSPPASQPKSESTATFGMESSFDFGSVSANSASGAAGGSNLGTSSSGSGAAPGKAAPRAPSAQDWDSLFADLDSPSDSATTTTATATTAAAPPPKDSRPNAPGRALTQEGEHDDPILKNLTGMGYSRADAVLALEKYDYNLERAANYLANQS